MHVISVQLVLLGRVCEVSIVEYVIVVPLVMISTSYLCEKVDLVTVRGLIIVLGFARIEVLSRT